MLCAYASKCAPIPIIFEKMSELINHIQRRGGDFGDDYQQGTELVSKIPPQNLREADLRLGILFNG